MLWITLIWLWNGVNLSIYEHVTHFVANIQHRAPCVLTWLLFMQTYVTMRSRRRADTVRMRKKYNEFHVSKLLFGDAEP